MSVMHVATLVFSAQRLDTHLARVRRELERAYEARRNAAFLRCLQQDATERRARIAALFSPTGGHHHG